MDALNQPIPNDKLSTRRRLSAFFAVGYGLAHAQQFTPVIDETKIVARSVPSYRKGACKCCGKPNVRAGRKTGKYLCLDCMEKGSNG